MVSGQWPVARVRVKVRVRVRVRLQREQHRAVCVGDHVIERELAYAQLQQAGDSIARVA